MTMCPEDLIKALAMELPKRPMLRIVQVPCQPLEKALPLVVLEEQVSKEEEVLVEDVPEVAAVEEVQVDEIMEVVAVEVPVQEVPCVILEEQVTKEEEVMEVETVQEVPVQEVHCAVLEEQVTKEDVQVEKVPEVEVSVQEVPVEKKEEDEPVSFDETMVEEAVQKEVMNTKLPDSKLVLLQLLQGDDSEEVRLEIIRHFTELKEKATMVLKAMEVDGGEESVEVQEVEKASEKVQAIVQKPWEEEKEEEEERPPKRLCRVIEPNIPQETPVKRGVGRPRKQK